MGKLAYILTLSICIPYALYLNNHMERQWILNDIDIKYLEISRQVELKSAVRYRHKYRMILNINISINISKYLDNHH